jgi:hypothetical protein
MISGTLYYQRHTSDTTLTLQGAADHRGAAQGQQPRRGQPGEIGLLCPFGRPFWLGFTYAPPVLVTKY